MDPRTSFLSVTTDPRYLANLDWGAPRPGHPEGTIRAHIAELEANLETLKAKLTEGEYWKLKLLIHTHDTFKPDAQPDVPITDPKSHASLARAFLATHCNDPDLLTVAQLHDEPYALYLQTTRKGTHNAARFESLLHAINDWNLFLAFIIIDGCTKGKSREPLHWLFGAVAGKVESKFSVADIIA